jgi:multiple sugar transport system permease protein
LAAIYILVVVSLFFFLFPIAWVVQNSFKTMYQIFQIPPLLIYTPTFSNYIRLFKGAALQVFANSLTISFINMALALLLGIPTAYSLARFKSRVNQNVSFWILTVRMAPAFGVIVPFYLMMHILRLIDTIPAVALAHLTFNLPFAIWLMKTYFEELPRELEEAALLDGASRWQTLYTIIVPVSAPMLVAVSILAFLLSWNEFMFAFLLTSREARTVPVYITALAGTHFLDWPMMTTISTVAMIPAFAFMGYVQRFIVKGLTMGAVR